MYCLVWSGLLPGPGSTYIYVYVGAAPLQRHPTVPIFAAGSGFESPKSRRNGPWLLSSCGHSRRTPNYTTLPVQFPRLSLCLSRSVRHGRGWGRSRRLGATAPRRSSHGLPPSCCCLFGPVLLTELYCAAMRIFLTANQSKKLPTNQKLLTQIYTYAFMYI